MVDIARGHHIRPPAAEDIPAPPRGRRRLRRLVRRRSVRVLLVLVALLTCWVAWSLSQALTAPGDDSVPARVAGWARDHQLGFVVTALETVQYDINPPAVGGTPTIAMEPPPETLLTQPQASGAPSSATGSTSTPPGASQKTQKPALPSIVLPPLASPAGPSLPGEGTWRVLGRVDGVDALQAAFVRPDAQHTSYVVAVASMDPRVLRFQLHPGHTDPGPGDWGVPPTIPPETRDSLVAAFNGGFKVAESGGGFYLNGVTRGKLTDGAASMVFYKDGHVAVGAWGREVSMTPDVVGVRQNLRLMVDQSTVSPAVDLNTESVWGASIGGKAFVWRSGVGVAADGRVIFVYGPALSVRSLATLLQRAGAVQAMELDINPAWMTFMSYAKSADPANPTPVKLLPNQEEEATRYYGISSRDFIAVHAK